MSNNTNLSDWIIKREIDNSEVLLRYYKLYFNGDDYPGNYIMATYLDGIILVFVDGFDGYTHTKSINCTPFEFETELQSKSKIVVKLSSEKIIDKKHLNINNKIKISKETSSIWGQ